MKKILVTLLACAALCVSCQKNKVYVSEINLEENSYSVVEGGTTQIKFTVLPVNAENKQLSFTPEKSGICTINDSGLITGVKAGTTAVTIAATDGSRALNTCVVKVTAKQ